MINFNAIWQLASTLIKIGAVIGAGLGAFLGFQFLGWLGAGAGLLVGALLGATLGLDLTLVPIPTAGSRRKQPPPPFTSGLMLALLGLGTLLFGLYSWGSLTLTCQRNTSNWVDCQRGGKFWLGQVQTTDETFPGVRRATQSRPDLVVLVTANSDHDMLFNFAPDTGARINQFLDSNEPSLAIEANSLWFFPPLLFVLSVLSLGFSIPVFFSARRKLAETLEKQVYA